MGFEITGTLIDKQQTQILSEKFKKREFVVEYRENSNLSFTELLKFQLTNEKCALIDNFNLNESIKVYFNLRGRKWEKDGVTSYFTNLEAWKIETLNPSVNVSANELPDENLNNIDELPESDLPF